MTATVRTVLGPVEPAALGRTSVHEHVLTVLDHVAYTPVETEEGRRLGEEPVSLATRWYVRQQWVGVRDNLRLDSEVVAAAEEIGRAHV